MPTARRAVEMPNAFMKPRYWIVIGITLGLAEVATYFINPFHTASADLLTRFSGIHLYRQTSQSMLPSIPQGGYFLASAWPYISRAPQVGDIVIFKYPPDPSVIYAKRIVAIGGQTLQIKNCVVIVDGQVLHEPYVERARARKAGSCSADRVLVPENGYLVFGDNRDNSEDSRYWGILPRDHIIGKVVWP
jgi:signal peptidase I